MCEEWDHFLLGFLLTGVSDVCSLCSFSDDSVLLETGCKVSALPLKEPRICFFYGRDLKLKAHGLNPISRCVLFGSYSVVNLNLLSTLKSREISCKNVDSGCRITFRCGSHRPMFLLAAVIFYSWGTIKNCFFFFLVLVLYFLFLLLKKKKFKVTLEEGEGTVLWEGRAQNPKLFCL